MDFTKLVADGAMRALALHANNQGKDGAWYLPQLKANIKAEYSDLMDTLKNALESHMGDAVYREIINTYCNAWAVKALNS